MSLRKYQDEIKGVRDKIRSHARDLAYKQNNVEYNKKDEETIILLDRCSTRLSDAERMLERPPEHAN